MPLLLLVLTALSLSNAGGDRMIVQFDFEEARIRPLQMPLAFEQVGEGRIGSDFPRFGGMSLTQDPVAEGQFAFRFDLKGRSMAARTVAGAVPVQPQVDHRIQAQVQVHGLQHASVQLRAWLIDAAGQVIEGSQVTSRPLQPQPDAAPMWETLHVLVPGGDASELGLELRLIQGMPASGRPGDVQSRPRIEDVSGSVIFDDIRIEQWPTLSFKDVSRIGLHHDLDPVLDLRIHDPSGEPTRHVLEVHDSHGRLVFSRAGDVPAGGLDERVVLGLLTGDWYRAQVVVQSGHRVLKRDALAFATGQPNRAHRPEPRIRVDLTDHEAWSQRADLAVDLLGHLGVGEAIVPVWHRAETFQSSWPSTRDHVDELRRLGVTPMLAINWIPPEHRDLEPLDVDDAATLVSKHPATIDPLIEAAVIAWGDTASQWRVGRRWDDPTSLAGAQKAITDAIGGLVVNLQVSVGEPVTIPLTTGESPRTAMRTASIGLLQAWQDGVTPITLAAPWRTGTHGLEPTPAYPALCTLAQALSGRPNVVDVPAAPGQRAMLLEGEHREPIIVVWRTDAASINPIRLPLAAQEPVCRDVLGNDIDCLSGDHECHVLAFDLPVIIEHISPETIHLMAGLHLQPDHLLPTMKVHDHTLVLHNTLGTPMRGHLVATTLEGVELRPRVIGLDLPPDGVMNRLLEIVVTTPLAAGPLPVHWEVRLDDGQRIPMTTWLEVGLDQLDVHWKTHPPDPSGDLVVELTLVNRGNAVRQVEASLHHAAIDMVAPHRLRVEAGQTLSQIYRIPAGRSTLSGTQIAALLEEPSQSMHLRDVIVVPDLTQRVQVDPISSP